MIRNVTRLEFKKNDKDYHLTCEMDSPLTDVMESLVYFMDCINKVQIDFDAQQEEKRKQEAVEKTE